MGKTDYLYNSSGIRVPAWHITFSMEHKTLRSVWKGPEVTRKSFTVNDLIEMFRHWNAGRSQVEIHQALGIDRKTIRKYLQPAVRDGIEPAPVDPNRDRTAAVQRSGHIEIRIACQMACKPRHGGIAVRELQDRVPALPHLD